MTNTDEDNAINIIISSLKMDKDVENGLVNIRRIASGDIDLHHFKHSQTISAIALIICKIAPPPF